MIFLVPFIMLASVMDIQMQKGLSASSNELTKEADLLAGDAISNFKTVQSFANEDMIVAKYAEFLAPINNVTVSSNVKIGFAFGLS